MEQEISVNKVNQKIAKNGKNYTMLETDIGKMSVWSDQIRDKFLAGKRYKVTTEQENGYTNVLGIEEDIGNFVPKIEPFKEAREDKARLMEISYAKDIFIALMTHAQIKNLEFDALANAQLSALCIKNIDEAINGKKTN